MLGFDRNCAEATRSTWWLIQQWGIEIYRSIHKSIWIPLLGQESYYVSFHLILPKTQVAPWLRIHLPGQGMQVRSSSRKDPPKEEVATHSSFLTGRFLGQKSLAGYSPWACQQSATTEDTHTHIPPHTHLCYPPR